MPISRSPIELLLHLIDEAFDQAAWHGPNLRGSLRGVSAVEALWRPGRGRHTIRELALHCAYWKHAVRRRLTRAEEWSFPLEGANWFVVGRDRTWRDDVRLLVDEHRQLRAAIASYPAKALDRPIDKKGQTAGYSIRGIAAHDLYHAGQIQLIRKLADGRKGT